MRKGPDYQMYIPLPDRGEMKVNVPLELVEDFSKFTAVNWRDNGDGTYTLTPFKE